MAGNCGSACPAPGGFYAYQPSIGGNTTFITIYGLLVLVTLFLGRRHGTVWYSSLLTASHLLQIIAFVGRILLHRVRDSQRYFLIFLLGTLLAPLLAASTILSALPCKLVTSAKIKSPHGGISGLYLGIQGLITVVVGLEVAGAVLVCYGQRVLQETKSTIIIITGLGVQTFSLILILGVCVAAFCHGSKRAYGHHTKAEDDSLLANHRRGLEAASVAILLHSVYRIVEMAMGISGILFQSETAFMVANGALPLVYCMLLSIFHPKNAAKRPSTSASRAGEKRRRPAPLTPEDSYPAHHGYAPNIALQRSPSSQNSHTSNPPEVPSGSPGLPANPRPTQKSAPSPPATNVHGSKPTPILGSASPQRVWKRGKAPQEMVETDSLW